jgi:large subunit ribosomal protein L10
MNRDQKAAVVEEVAAQIRAADAIFAVDFRGMSVPQAAELRARLNEAGAAFRVVKNTLTLRAVERAGADELKGVLEGPTALTFVTEAGGDVALAAKALSQFRRQVDALRFKGGRMNGEPLSADQIESIARLPPREALDAQLVGVVAAPLTGLVRSLGALIGGLAVQLGQIAEQGLLPAGGAAPEAAPAETDAPADAPPASGEAGGDSAASGDDDGKEG